MAADMTWLNWQARVLGVFPLVERRRDHGAKSKRGRVHPAAFGSPRDWTSDFSQPSRPKDVHKSILLRPSTPWLIYSVVGSTLLLSSMLWDVISDFLKSEADKASRWTTRTDACVTLCEYLSLLCATMAGNVAATIRRDAVVRHAELLAEVDQLLGLSPPRLSSVLALFLVAMLGVLATDMTIWLITDSSWFKDMIEDMPLYLTFYTCFVSEALFMRDALAIKSRLVTLNQILATASPQPGRRAEHGVPMVLPQTLSVRRLAAAHALLCDAMDTLSARYGVPLLFDMMALLLNLIVTSYFFLEDMLPTSLAVPDPKLTLMELVFACTHITRIVLLVEPAAMAGREVGRTGELVGYLCTTVPHGGPMHHSLIAFSVQLQHQRATVSACGFWEMDRSLIVAITGSVATYLLVLLQLKAPGGTATATSDDLKNRTVK